MINFRLPKMVECFKVNDQEGDRTFWEQFESEVSEFKSKTAGMEESKVSKKSLFFRSLIFLSGAGLDPRPNETFEQHKSTL